MKTNYKALREARGSISESLSKEKFDYEYPPGLKLKPGSEHSNKIIEEVHLRIQASRERTDPLVPKNKEMDRIHSAYMPESAYDMTVKGNDSRKQLTFVVPMTFAMREMFLTYFTQTFLTRDIIHRYKGVGETKARIGGALLERVIGRQASWFGHRLHWNTVWSDALMYGRGRAVLNWTKRKGQAARKEKVDQLMALMLEMNNIKANDGDVLRWVDEVTVAEGVEIQPIDWYQCIFDPNVSPNNTQKAEYGGWLWQASAMDILRRETDPEEQMFNGKYAHLCAKNGRGRSIYWSKDDERVSGSTEYLDSSDRGISNSLGLATIVVDMIPNEWFGAGHAKVPQKWQFTVAADDVVVQAHKLTHRHGQYPWIDVAPNDGFRLSPVGHLSVTYAEQQFASWLMKSRAEAAITIQTSPIFVDNSRVNVDDLSNPEMAKFVRVRNAAYGEGGIDRFVHQLKLENPTANNISEIALIEQAARFGNGTDSIRLEDMPERPTKAGVDAVQGGQFSRMSRLALIIDEQAMNPAAVQIAMDTQQWMGEDVYAPVLGRYEQELRKAYGVTEPDGQVLVGPWDIDVPFEVETYSGARPGTDDITALSEMLKPMFPIIAPQIAMDYRMSDIFAEVLRKTGIENIADFKAPPNVQVMPDEQFNQELAAGNLVGGPKGGMPQ